MISSYNIHVDDYPHRLEFDTQGHSFHCTASHCGLRTVVSKSEISKLSPLNTTCFDPSIQPVIYTFDNVSCSYPTTKISTRKKARGVGKRAKLTRKDNSYLVLKEDKKIVLNGVSGVLMSGWLVAIMGPSGMFVVLVY